MSKGRLGILVGGGPAPGLNGVIAAATIEGINQGYEVIGFRDGFKHLATGDTTQIKPLAIRDVRDIHLKGGSILGTARTNPTKSEEHMKNIFTVFHKLGITALVIAVLHLIRPSIVLMTGGVIAAGLGIVLYKIELSGLAIGLLILGFARPAPATA